MPLPKPPKIRLAVVGTPAPEVFNFYQVVSVMLSLYFKAGDRQEIKENKVAWDDATNSLLTQVGNAFTLLDYAQSSARDQIPLQPNPVLTARIGRLALRMIACEEQLNVWTPHARWARILLMLENKVKNIAQQIADYNPYVSAEMLALIELGGARRAFVAKLSEDAIRDALDLQASFALPQAI